MTTKEDPTNKIIMLFVTVVLVGTLGAAGFNILANANFVSNYTDAFNASGGFTGAGKIYLSNSELKSGSLWIYNSTYSSAITQDYTVDTASGIVTIVTQTNGGLLNNGSRYTASYQKDNVSSVVKTIAVLVLSIIVAVGLLIIFYTRYLK